MTSRKKISWIVLGVTLAGLLALAPMAWRAGALFWAKHKARAVFDQFPPEVRSNLNSVPTKITLPDFNPDAQPVDTAPIGNYIVRFPRPTTRPTTRPADPKNIHLSYPRFDAILFPPSSLSQEDALAQKLHFKDTYAFEWTIYHMRLDDLDAQPDLPSLQQFVAFISTKPARTFVAEEFDRPDMRGFILAPIPGEKLSRIEAYLTPTHSGTGVWITDTGGITMQDIHQFLAALRFDPK